MSGLHLIQDYSSDTDEETGNSNEENKTFFNVKKTKTKLPLPESILSLKGVTHHEEVVDDPSEHDGRTRSFKHERGNWATLVYIDYIPNDEIMQWMKNTLEQTVKAGNLFEEFHAVKNICNGYSSFAVELNGIKVYCNDDKTRTFMGITVQSTNDSLVSLTRALDKLLEEYDLPPFYEDASYHASFFWILGDQRKTLEALLPRLTSSFHDFLTHHPEHRYFRVDFLKCKIGNKLYNFNLR